MRKATCARAFCQLLLLAFCVQPVLAQTWNYVGPYAVPSRILSVASDPRSDSVIYVAAAGGGIWKTQNGGFLWTHLIDSGPEQICTLTLDPRFPDVIYAGTGDDQSPRPMQGIVRSQDAGKTWTFLSRFTNRPVCAIAVDPANSQQNICRFQRGFVFLFEHRRNLGPGSRLSGDLSSARRRGQRLGGHDR